MFDVCMVRVCVCVCAVLRVRVCFVAKTPGAYPAHHGHAGAGHLQHGPGRRCRVPLHQAGSPRGNDEYW